MYKPKKADKTSIQTNQSYQGETIMQKVNRIVNNKEPIKDGAPRIYTARKDGVLPDYDIRTDRFEHAIDATDNISKTKLATRMNYLGEEAKKGMAAEAKTETKDGAAEPIQGTDKTTK